MKSTIYYLIIGTIIIFLYTSAMPFVYTDDNNIIIPCSSYNVGSYRVYTSTSNNKSSILKEYVVLNKNGIIERLDKYFEKGQDKPLSTTTDILSEKDGNVAILKSESEFSTTTYIKPYPMCGFVPKVSRLITVTKDKLGESGKADTTVQIWTNKFIGEETVKVKAGEFKVSVIEGVNKLPYGTVTTITYYAQDIGMVKNFMIMKMNYPEYKTDNSQPTLTESDINRGIKSLEEGKNISWLDSLSKSSDTKKIGFSTSLMTSTTELVRYKIQ